MHVARRGLDGRTMNSYKTNISVLALAGVLAALSACGGEKNDDGATGGTGGGSGGAGASGGGGSAPVSGICATEHAAKNADGDDVTYCDAFFEAPPFVRPPPDVRSTDSSPSVLYGAIDPTRLRFVDRDGNAYQILDANGHFFPNPLEVHPENPQIEGFPAALRMNSNRAHFTLYQLKGLLRQESDGTSSLWLQDGRPAIMVKGTVIDGLGVGAWEGTVSGRNADGSWDPAKRVPIRLNFGAPTPIGNLPPWGILSGTLYGEAQDGEPSLPDGDISLVPGVIENTSAGVLGSDGTCFPSFAAMGEENPFYGATDGKVSLSRYIAMHSAGSLNVLFTYPPAVTGLSGNGMNFMGGTAGFGPSDWISLSPDLNLSSSPHSGDPSAVTHLLTIHRVKGGGGSCN